MKRTKRLTRRERQTEMQRFIAQHSRHEKPAPSRTTLNRHWRRAIESIARKRGTDRDHATALARKLGDEIAMLPLAEKILKARAEALADDKKRREGLMSRIRDHLYPYMSRWLGVDPARQEG